MRFSTIAIPALFSALTLAQPQTICVDDLIVRNINGTITSATFTVKPDNVSCSYNADVTAVNGCGESKYSFYIEEVSLSSYNVTIYKELGVAYGLYRESPFELVCRAGGSSASDYVCEQFGDKEITLTQDGQ